MLYHDKEEQHMKVVVIKSPKFLSGILRVIFRIKKEDCE
ncbi:MAG: stage V sporulation protein SpoVM [Ruminococcus sp.]|nr:stage V sporulation protein SpoVM [Ruminococcus sp.]